MSNRKRKHVDEVQSADRTKGCALIGSQFRVFTTDEAAVRSLSEELEELIFQQSSLDYRAELRKLVASLRRGPQLCKRLLQGEVKAAGLLSEPQMLLTEKQRESRAKVQKESLERCLNTSLGALGYFLLGIDCDASNCCISCERRHLEPREQMRGNWPPLQRNHVVPCDSYWIGQLNRDKLEERLRAQPLAVVLVKTHEWFANYPEFIGMAKHIFLTHRDLRGVVASYRRVKWELAISDAYVAEHMEWRKRCSLDLSYEEMMRNALVPLKAIAERLGFTLSQEQLAEVQSDLLQLKRSHCGNAVCQVTKLWPDHRSRDAEELQGKAESSNAQLNELKDPEYAQVLNSRFKEYQQLYEYI